jgi:hypothetical protein
VEKINLDWMALTLVEADRPGWFQRRHWCGPAGAADLLIGENDTQLDSPYVVSYEASEHVKYVATAQRRAHQM